MKSTLKICLTALVLSLGLAACGDSEGDGNDTKPCNGACGDQHCNTTTNACVACLEDAHCSGSAPVCKLSDNTCVQCTAAKGCGTGEECDTLTNTCVAKTPAQECTTDEECGAKKYCNSDKKCADKVCEQNSDCPKGQTCNTEVAGGKCVQEVTPSECETSATCAEDEYCTPEKSCAKAVCKKKSDCDEGYYCDTTAASGAGACVAETECDEGNPCEAGECVEGSCITQKQVPCADPGIADEHAVIESGVEVTVNWAEGDWEAAEPCAWNCAQGYVKNGTSCEAVAPTCTQDNDCTNAGCVNGACVTQKQVVCSDPDVSDPNAVIESDVEVTVNWVEGDWEAAAACAWDCAQGYVKNAEAKTCDVDLSCDPTANTCNGNMFCNAGTWTNCATGSTCVDGVCQNDASPNVFISEYIVGTNSNKALEFYNAGEAAASCTVFAYMNGAQTPNYLHSFTIEPDTTYTYCNAASSDALKDLCTATGGSGTVVAMNGDDALELKCNGVVVDIFGKIGERPSVSWSQGELSTTTQILRRNCFITKGNTENADGFPALAREWSKASSNTDYSDMGSFIPCPCTAAQASTCITPESSPVTYYCAQTGANYAACESKCVDGKGCVACTVDADCGETGTCNAETNVCEAPIETACAENEVGTCITDELGTYYCSAVATSVDCAQECLAGAGCVECTNDADCEVGESCNVNHECAAATVCVAGCGTGDNDGKLCVVNEENPYGVWTNCANGCENDSCKAPVETCVGQEDIYCMSLDMDLPYCNETTGVCVACLNDGHCNSAGSTSNECNLTSLTCQPKCKNSRLDAGEECDPTVEKASWPAVNQSCAAYGAELEISYIGETSCTDNCVLDVSACTTCGNGQLDEDEGETCDDSMEDKSVWNQCPAGKVGTVTCNNCVIDTSDCQDPPTASVTNCHVQWPESITLSAANPSATVYGRFIIPAETTITSKLIYGSDTADIANWTAIDAQVNQGSCQGCAAGETEYQADFSYAALANGTYKYAYKFSENGTDWFYCVYANNDANQTPKTSAEMAAETRVGTLTIDKSAGSSTVHTQTFDFITSNDQGYANTESTTDGNGVTWTYTGRPNLSNSGTDYSIDGKGVILRYAENKITVSGFSGVTKVSFQYNWWGNKTEVTVTTKTNGTESGEILETKDTSIAGTEGKQTTELTFSGSSDATYLEIKPKTINRIIIDNLSITE